MSDLDQITSIRVNSVEELARTGDERQYQAQVSIYLADLTDPTADEFIERTDLVAVRPVRLRVGFQAWKQMSVYESRGAPATPASAPLGPMPMDDIIEIARFGHVDFEKARVIIRMAEHRILTGNFSVAEPREG